MRKIIGGLVLATLGVLGFAGTAHADTPLCGGQSSHMATPADCHVQKDFTFSGVTVTARVDIHVNADRTGSATYSLSKKVPVKVGIQLRIHDGKSSTSVQPFENFGTIPANTPAGTGFPLAINGPTGAVMCFSQSDFKAQPGVEGSGGHWDEKWRIGGPTFDFTTPVPQCQPQESTTTAAPTTTVAGATTTAPVVPSTALTATVAASGPLPATGGGLSGAQLALLAIAVGSALVVLGRLRYSD